MLTLGIPTRGRPEELSECLSTAHELASKPFRTVLLFGDDWKGYATFEPHLTWGPVHKYISSPRRYYYHDLNMLYGLMREHADEDLIVISNDDNRFIVPDWDEIAAEMFASKLNNRGVLSFWQHPLHTYITSISYNDEVWGGTLAPEDYLFYFGDSERAAMLRARGEWGAIEPPLIWHTMEAQTDVEATHSYKAWYERDRRVYERRVALINRLMELESALRDATGVPG